MALRSAAARLVCLVSSRNALSAAPCADVVVASRRWRTSMSSNLPEDEAIDEHKFTAAEMVDTSRCPTFPLDDFVIIPNFVSRDEEEILFQELDGPLRRNRYQNYHWDNAITNYREMFRSRWGKSAQRVVTRILNTEPLKSLAHDNIHILDLAAGGEILPHVDSKEYVGEYVCGISLLSSAIMQFRNHDAGVASALVQRRSLYVMRRRVRYDYTHQVLLGPSLRWPMDGPEGVDFQRQRRITVLFR
eukprot:m.99882 g.99882  ORF g.99882 m.99882 type:complete len:246 (-) comp8913_c0_seq2:118-855(-)